MLGSWSRRPQSWPRPRNPPGPALVQFPFYLKFYNLEVLKAGQERLSLPLQWIIQSCLLNVETVASYSKLKIRLSPMFLEGRRLSVLPWGELRWAGPDSQAPCCHKDLAREGQVADGTCCVLGRRRRWLQGPLSPPHGQGRVCATPALAGSPSSWTTGRACARRVWAGGANSPSPQRRCGHFGPRWGPWR